MNFQDEVARSLIRGMGYRVARHLPIWLAAIALAMIYLLGGK